MENQCCLIQTDQLVCYRMRNLIGQWYSCEYRYLLRSRLLHQIKMEIPVGLLVDDMTVQPVIEFCNWNIEALPSERKDRSKT